MFVDWIGRKDEHLLDQLKMELFVNALRRGDLAIFKSVLIFGWLKLADSNVTEEKLIALLQEQADEWEHDHAWGAMKASSCLGCNEGLIMLGVQ